jgi:hypothetical protein
LLHKSTLFLWSVVVRVYITLNSVSEIPGFFSSLQYYLSVLVLELSWFTSVVEDNVRPMWHISQSSAVPIFLFWCFFRPKNPVGIWCFILSRLLWVHFLSQTWVSVAGIFFFCYEAHLLLLFLLLSFCFQWEDRMDKGLFRYDVTACETMVTFLNTRLFTLKPRIMVTCFISIYCLNSMYLWRQWISFHTHLEYML